MANKTIDELTAGTAMDGTELVHGVQGGNSRKFTADQIRGMAAGVSAAIAEGDLLYVNGDAEFVRLPKGAAGQVLVQNAGLTAPEWTTLPITKSYESSVLTTSAGGTVTLAHGLGALPKLIQTQAVCVTAENGYSIGDRLPIPVFDDSGSDSTGAAIVFDATNLTIRYSSGAIVAVAPHKTTGARAGMSRANWRLVVRAFA